jgi:hypothetical protein
MIAQNTHPHGGYIFEVEYILIPEQYWPMINLDKVNMHNAFDAESTATDKGIYQPQTKAVQLSASHSTEL